MDIQRTESTIKILIMDDEECIRDITTILLSKLGFRVDGAKDSDEAIKLFTEAIERGTRYHVILLDLVIKGGDGADVTLSAMKKLDPNVHAVLISGYHLSPLMLEPKKHGFCASLKKPFDAKDLRLLIEKFVFATSI